MDHGPHWGESPFTINIRSIKVGRISHKQEKVNKTMTVRCHFLVLPSPAPANLGNTSTCRTVRTIEMEIVIIVVSADRRHQKQKKIAVTYSFPWKEGGKGCLQVYNKWLQTIKSSEYWVIYRGLTFLAVVWFGSSLTPVPSPFRHQVVRLSQSLFLSYVILSSGVVTNHEKELHAFEDPHAKGTFLRSNMALNTPFARNK